VEGSAAQRAPRSEAANQPWMYASSRREQFGRGWRGSANTNGFAMVVGVWWRVPWGGGGVRGAVGGAGLAGWGGGGRGCGGFPFSFLAGLQPVKSSHLSGSELSESIRIDDI